MYKAVTLSSLILSSWWSEWSNQSRRSGENMTLTLWLLLGARAGVGGCKPGPALLPAWLLINKPVFPLKHGVPCPPWLPWLPGGWQFDPNRSPPPPPLPAHLSPDPRQYFCRCLTSILGMTLNFCNRCGRFRCQMSTLILSVIYPLPKYVRFK